MAKWVPRKGVAWRKIQDVGVIFNPWGELMIGLDAAGFALWERLLAGGPAPGDADPAPALLEFFRAMGLFETGEGASTPAVPPEQPEHVLWTEAFQPLAFTLSCAHKPLESDVCDSRPYTGAGRGSPERPSTSPPPAFFRRPAQ